MLLLKNKTKKSCFIFSKFWTLGGPACFGWSGCREHRLWLTLLIIAGNLVGHPVVLRRRRQHEGEAHKQRRVLRKRAVSLCDVTGLTREIRAAAGGITSPNPVTWGQDTIIYIREEI